MESRDPKTPSRSGDVLTPTCEPLACGAERVADFAAALRRMGGSRQLLGEMILFFREDVPHLVGEIETSMALGDATLAKRSAHSIKGLAATFDAESVMQCAASIEACAARDDLGPIPPLLSNLRCHIANLELAFDALEKV